MQIMRSSIPILMLTTLCAAESLVAQPALRERVDPATRRTVVSVNPFGIFAEYVAGDVEIRTAPFLTVGAGVSINMIDDYNNYRAFELKARYYPAERALQGLSLAATVGISTARANGYNGFYAPSWYTFDGMPPFDVQPERVTRPTFGTELSYQWILGPSSRFVAVLGAGVKRMFGKEGGFDPVNIPLLPTARVNIGVAF